MGNNIRNSPSGVLLGGSPSFYQIVQTFPIPGAISYSASGAYFVLPKEVGPPLVNLDITVPADAWEIGDAIKIEFNSRPELVLNAAARPQTGRVDILLGISYDGGANYIADTSMGSGGIDLSILTGTSATVSAALDLNGIIVPAPPVGHPAIMIAPLVNIQDFAGPVTLDIPGSGGGAASLIVSVIPKGGVASIPGGGLQVPIAPAAAPIV